MKRVMRERSTCSAEGAHSGASAAPLGDPVIPPF
jgi:hypothetical protein